MELDKLKEHVDARLDRIESKLDNHLERLSAAETSIEWMKGHIKTVVSLGIALIGVVATTLFNMFTK